MQHDIFELIAFILPAYVANATPVVVSKLVPWTPHPLDGGKNWFDGRRIFGNTKTVEGLVSGILAGTITGLVEQLLDVVEAGLEKGFILSTGAVFGDLLGSFIKRRLGLPPGSPAPLLDQLDFLAGALTAAKITGLNSLTLTDILVLILLTLVLHPLTNFLAYLLNLKKVPW